MNIGALFQAVFAILKIDGGKDLLGPIVTFLSTLKAAPNPLDPAVLAKAEAQFLLDALAAVPQLGMDVVKDIAAAILAMLQPGK